MNKFISYINNNIDNNKEIIERITKKYEKLLYKDFLPNDMIISTMTISCHFDTVFNVEYIGKYMELNNNTVVCIKYGKKGSERTLVPLKKKKKKKNERVFYNQTTLLIRPEPWKKYINMKLFKNGSIQMTGVKNICDSIKALNILCNELKKIRGIKFKDRIEQKKYVTKYESLSIEKIIDYKICMINSGFNIGFVLCREELYNILRNDDDIQCKYDIDRHACVDIKYYYKDRKKISIFVFEKGSIIITGANNCNHILEAYKYITNKLYVNYKSIKNIEPVIKEDDIRKYLV